MLNNKHITDTTTTATLHCLYCTINMSNIQNPMYSRFENSNLAHFNSPITPTNQAPGSILY